jgi:hypothetical protein
MRHDQARRGIVGSRGIAALILLALAALPAAAQPQTRSAVLAVTVVVTRSCSLVSPDAAPAPGSPSFPANQNAEPRVQIKCGQDLIVYPLQPGTPATPVGRSSAPPGVAQSKDGRTVTIQF